MAVFAEGPRNAEWLISEANGSRSRDVVTLDQDDDLYVTGSLVDPTTGTYITAGDGEDIEASASAVIVYLTTDASAAATDATVISRDAEVMGDLLVLPTGITLAAAKTLLAASGIIVR